MRDEDSLMFPPLEKLLEKIPDKYALVLTATKRAKQIILQHRLNPGSDDAQSQRKPLSIALQDIADGVVDQTALQTPEVFLEDYFEDEGPSYPEIDIPGDDLSAGEAEGESASLVETEDDSDYYDDLSDVEDVLDIDLFSDDSDK